MTVFKLRLLFLCLLIVPCLCSAAETNNGLQEIIGYAYDRKSGEVLYTEHHYQHFKDGAITRHHVEYKRPDGEPLATKTLDYANHPYAPDFHLQDWRDGYIESGTHSDKGYLLERREKDGGSLQKKLISISNNRDLVADSGFDRYVKAKLATLIDKGNQTFELAVAGRLISLNFEARVIGQGELFGRPAANIRVEPDSLLRLFTSGIDITYDLESGYLLRYEGISNIRNPNGERYDARIDFLPEDRKFTAIYADIEE